MSDFYLKFIELYSNNYNYFIVIGLSILAGAGWLLRSYRTQILLSRKLIHLNEELNYDLPDFLRQSWPLLKDSGFTGMSWALEWFGTNVSGQNGKCVGQVIEKRFNVDQISLLLRLYSQKRTWDYQFVVNTLADNYFLLVRMNLWVKLGTVRRSFEQTAKLTVFLQHDIKNLTQLIKLSTDQLENPVKGQEIKLLESLQEVIPAVRDRAEHMLNTLTNKTPDAPDSTEKLEKLLSQTAKMYELPCVIDGNAEVSVQKNILQSIIDNILGNFSRQTSKPGTVLPDIQIKLENSNGSVIVSIADKNGAPCLWPERLFEPFWSEFGTGRGIGLYQARQQAFAVGGSLTAESLADKPLNFILTLPAKYNSNQLY